jgi:hypothetical protein
MDTVFERAKTVHALDCAATVIGEIFYAITFIQDEANIFVKVLFLDVLVAVIRITLT